MEAIRLRVEDLDLSSIEMAGRDAKAGDVDDWDREVVDSRVSRGRAGTSGAGRVGTGSSIVVQVVAARTGLLIRGRAVLPGFRGGSAGPGGTKAGNPGTGAGLVCESSGSGLRVNPLKCPNILFLKFSSFSGLGRRLAHAGSDDKLESIVSSPVSGWGYAGRSIVLTNPRSCLKFKKKKRVSGGFHWASGKI